MPSPTDVAEPVRDRRLPPFCYQTHEALDALRREFSGAKLSTALSVYLTFTEVANRKGGAPARGGFRAARKEIAELSGVSTKTLDRYVRSFEELGLLEVERERAGDVNLPNVWALSDPPSVTGVPSPTGVSTLASPVSPLAGAILTGEEERQEETPIAPPAIVESHNRPATVDRKPVTDSEYENSLLALHWFNATAGTNYTSEDWHRKIIARLREHPELPIEAHEIVIRRAFADPWWKGPVSPSVVYGNAALFERSVHAVRVKPPDLPMTTEEMAAYDG